MASSIHKQPEELSQAELAALVRQLFVRIHAQEAEIQRLKAELENRQKPKKPSADSTNSSQPPSRDRKAGKKPTDGEPAKMGPPGGHRKHQRPLSPHPDEIIEAVVRECAHCQHSLADVDPAQVHRRQITEVPPVRPYVIETRQHAVICPECQQVNLGLLPPELPAERTFGPRLEALVVYEKEVDHVSVKRIVEKLRTLYGITISQGAVVAILRRAGVRSGPVAAEILDRVKEDGYIKSDETTVRVNGDNWWMWVFRSAADVYFRIVRGRGAWVIEETMDGAVAVVWTSDCLAAQLKAPALVFQLCLAHQIRDLQRVIDACSSLWAQRIQAFFRGAIHWRNRFLKGEITLNGYLRGIAPLERELDELLSCAQSDSDAERLRKRYLKHREKLLTFLFYPEVDPTNNGSEQALRTAVVHNKVTNGFRSEWGAHAYASLLSVIATARQKGEDIFQTLVDLMGEPVLRTPEQSTA